MVTTQGYGDSVRKSLPGFAVWVKPEDESDFDTMAAFVKEFGKRFKVKVPRHKDPEKRREVLFQRLVAARMVSEDLMPPVSQVLPESHSGEQEDGDGSEESVAHSRGPNPKHRPQPQSKAGRIRDAEVDCRRQAILASDTAAKAAARVLPGAANNQLVDPARIAAKTNKAAVSPRIEATPTIAEHLVSVVEAAPQPAPAEEAPPQSVSLSGSRDMAKESARLEHEIAHLFSERGVAVPRAVLEVLNSPVVSPERFLHLKRIAHNLRLQKTSPAGEQHVRAKKPKPKQEDNQPSDTGYETMLRGGGVSSDARRKSFWLHELLCADAKFAVVLLENVIADTEALEIFARGVSIQFDALPENLRGQACALVRKRRAEIRASHPKARGKRK